MTEQTIQQGGLRRVVVCIDETEISHKAVHWCLRNVIKTDTDLLTMLHVVTEPVNYLKEFRQVEGCKSPAEFGIESPREMKVIDIVEKHIAGFEKEVNSK